MPKTKKTNSVQQPAAHDSPSSKSRSGKGRRSKILDKEQKERGSSTPHDQEAFLNRELGAIGFNKIVLAMARNPDVPLLERLRYLCIVSSNLDEFFEIRIAELRERIDAGDRSLSIDGRAPRETYDAAIDAASLLQTEQYRLLNKEILPALAKEGVVLLRREEWTEEQGKWIASYFEREILPLLTPIGLDPAHPFPRLANKSLNFLVELSGKDAYGRTGTVAIVPAPHALPRLIPMPPEISGLPYAYAFLSSALRAHVGQLFPGMKVLGLHQFRVTRNSDLFVDEEEVKNLLATIQGELPQRNFGAAVRLEVADTCPKSARDFLLRHFELTEREMAICPGPVNLVRLMRIPDLVDRPDLKFPDFEPGFPKALRKGGANMFEAIAKGDILLHHPYQSYSPVTQLLVQACDDPDVSAIKMTVYRTGEDSALMDALVRAAQKGKEVTVVLELMARFDEAANIRWAARLEEAGAHVVFGAVGYKTHAKMLMIVRREIDPATGGALLRRYVHLGTGNYNPRTAKLYTDFSLFTRDPGFGADATEIFQQLTGLGQPQQLERLAQAPFGLHDMVLAGIHEQTELAAQGKPCMIRGKMNALLEPQVIRALYLASKAGVPVKLIVRGMCALRPGVAGLSENIEVRSAVGRYLEHHRLFAFGEGDSAQVWLSSADWMDRNFFRRIEVAFPILDKKLRKRAVQEGFDTYWNSERNVYVLQADGDRALLNPEASAASEAQRQLATLLGRGRGA